MQVLKLYDIINSEYGVCVNGSVFDAEVNVIFTKTNDAGVQLTSVQVGEVWLISAGRHIKLDQNYLKTGQRSLYVAIVTEFEIYAHCILGVTPESDWQDHVESRVA